MDAPWGKIKAINPRPNEKQKQIERWKRLQFVPRTVINDDFIRPFSFVSWSIYFTKTIFVKSMRNASLCYYRFMIFIHRQYWL